MLKNNLITDITCEIDSYPNLSLDEILSIKDKKIKMQMLTLYRDYIKNNMTNRISKNVITKSILINNDSHLSVRSKQCIKEINKLLENKSSEIIKYNNSIIDLENKIQNEKLINTSTYLFPGDIVYFYSLVREYKANSSIICDISGSVIQKGSYYVYYRPRINDITTREHYILDKSLKIETSYRHLLPKNIMEFEEWVRKLNGSYSNPTLGDEIDFYTFSRNYKNDLSLIKLRHKKEGYIKQ
jgi:hypothetical protein